MKPTPLLVMYCYLCCGSVNPFSSKALILLLRRIRLTTLLLAANRKASWNKARLRYKCFAYHWTTRI